MKDKEVLEIKDVVERPLKVVEYSDDENYSACTKCVLLHICDVSCSLPLGYIFVFADKF